MRGGERGDWDRIGVIRFFFGLVASPVGFAGALLNEDVGGEISEWLSSRGLFNPTFS